jgi:hypothetical protein
MEIQERILSKKVHSLKEIGNSVLSKRMWMILSMALSPTNKYHSDFEESITIFKKTYQENNYLNWPTKFGACKGCEFKTTPEQEQDGLLSGSNIASQQHQWTASEFSKPMPCKSGIIEGRT